MVSRARLKAVLTCIALYAIAAGFIAYFGVNAYTGRYGLDARVELDQEIARQTTELADLKAERLKLEHRVSSLRSDRVDPDMLDEQARLQLGYASPRDLVRMLPAN
ncbi:MAG: septum formation initiator family protein [Rhizobiales bacterium]|nr:septum formation initiator family protein [Hyphomicrobiales bacterium]